MNKRDVSRHEQEIYDDEDYKIISKGHGLLETTLIRLALLTRKTKLKTEQDRCIACLLSETIEEQLIAINKIHVRTPEKIKEDEATKRFTGLIGPKIGYQEHGLYKNLTKKPCLAWDPDSFLRAYEIIKGYRLEEKHDLWKIYRFLLLARIIKVHHEEIVCTEARNTFKALSRDIKISDFILEIIEPVKTKILAKIHTFTLEEIATELFEGFIEEKKKYIEKKTKLFAGGLDPENKKRLSLLKEQNEEISKRQSKDRV